MEEADGRRLDDDDGAEALDGIGEEEQPGELPKMREVKARKARLHRKIQSHQMKELQEERLKMGQTMEGVLEQFQENRERMMDLERQVEQLKEREQQKASEIRRWQSSSDAMQKDTMRLKKQLAIVTERLAKKEEEAVEVQQQMDRVLQEQAPHLAPDAELVHSMGALLAEECARLSVEQLQMRLADYESLVVEFAEQASKVMDVSSADIDPRDLSPLLQNEETFESPPDVPPLPLLPDSDAPRESVVAELKAHCAAYEEELRALLGKCAEAEASAQEQRMTCELALSQAQSTAEDVEEEKAASRALRFELAERCRSDDQAERASQECAAAKADLEALQRCLDDTVSREAAELERFRGEVRDLSVRYACSESHAKHASDQLEQTRHAARLAQEVVEADRLDEHHRADEQAERAFRECASAKAQMEALQLRLDDTVSREVAELERLRGEMQHLTAEYACSVNHATHATHELEQARSDARLAREVAERAESKALQATKLELVDAQTGTEAQGAAGGAEDKLVAAVFDRADRQLAFAETPSAVLELQKEVAAAGLQRLRGVRRAETLDSLFSRVHDDVRRNIRRARDAKRESRRQNGESVLMRALHATCRASGAQVGAGRVDGEAADTAASPTMPEEHVGPEEREALLRRVTEAQEQAVAAKAEAQALQARLDSAVAIAREEAAAMIRERRAAEEKQQQVAAVQADAAPEHPRGGGSDFSTLRSTVEELQRWRAEADAAHAQVALLQLEAAEARAALMKCESRQWADLASSVGTADVAAAQPPARNFSVETDALALRVRSLQEHLNDEATQFDALASAHEEVLEMAGRLREENATLRTCAQDLREQLVAAVRALSEADTFAQTSIAEMSEGFRNERHSLSETFQEQLRLTAARADGAMLALSEERALRRNAEEAHEALAGKLEQVRLHAAQQEDALQSEVASLSAQRDMLDRHEARILAELEEAQRNIAIAQGERKLLEGRASTFSAALEEAAVERTALQARLEAAEICADDQRCALQQRLAEVDARLQASVTEELIAAESLREVTAKLAHAEQRIRDAEAAVVEPAADSVAQAAVMSIGLADAEREELRAEAEARRAEVEVELAEALQRCMVADAGREALRVQSEARRAELEHELAQALHRCAASDAERETLGAQAEARRAESEHELAEALQRCAAADAEREALTCHAETRHADLQRELTEALQRCGAAEAEREALGGQAETRRSELEHELAQALQRCTFAEAERESTAQWASQSAAAAQEAVSRAAIVAAEREQLELQLRDALQACDAAKAEHVVAMERAVQFETVSSNAARQMEEFLEAVRQCNAASAERDVAVQRVAHLEEVAEEAANKLELADAEREALGFQAEAQRAELERQLSEALQRCAAADAERDVAAHQALQSEVAMQEAASCVSIVAAETEQLKRQLGDALRECAAAKNEFETAMELVGQSEADSQRLKATCDEALSAAVAERDAMAHQVQALQHHLEDIASRQAAGDDQLVAVSSDITRRDAEFERLSGELLATCFARDFAAEQVAHFHEQVEEAAKERSEMRAAFREQQQAHAAELAEVGRLAGASRDQALHEQSESFCQELQQAVQTREEELKKQLQSEAQNYMRKMQDTFRLKLAEAAAGTQVFEAQRNQLQLQLADMQQHLNQLGALLVEKEAGIDTVRREVAEQRASFTGEAEAMSSRAFVAEELDQARFESIVAEHRTTIDRLMGSSLDLEALAADRDDLRRRLDEAAQELQTSATNESLLEQHVQQTSWRVERLQGELAEQVAAGDAIRSSLNQAERQRDSLASELAASGTLSKAVPALQADLERAKIELNATVAENHALQCQLNTTREELESQSRAMRSQLDANIARLADSEQLLREQQETAGGIQDMLAHATTERGRLEARLADAERCLDEQRLERDALLSQQETTAAPPAITAPLSPLASSAAFEIEQAVAEREALEAAFRAQMEEAQRKLSSQAMELQSLRHELALASSLSATATPQTSAPDAPRSSADVDMGASQEQDRLSNRCRQLQFRVQAVEEEKAIMLQEMREHILQLARENFDLKMQSQQRREPLQLPSRPQSAGAQIVEAPPQSKMDADEPQVAKSLEEEPTGGRGWLSYVLSPFLTDSDLREIHAESVAGEALKAQPAVPPLPFAPS